jgi:DNA-binding transcriptional regulator YiaG
LKKIPLDNNIPMDYIPLMTPDDLKKWRKRNGYSQARLAKVLGVITLTVSRWERGVREIPSFLHLALECLEMRGGEKKVKGQKKERR